MKSFYLDKFKKAVEREDGLLPKIKIVSVGGAGKNVVNCMIASGMHGVEFIVTDCHADTLKLSNAENRIQLGENLTKGLFAHGDPEIGQKAAEEARDVLIENLRGADIVYIVAGMGQGIGTGASPIVAKCAKEAGAMTIAVVTKPFPFEGQRKMAQAEAGIVKLKEYVDILVPIVNGCLLPTCVRKKYGMIEAFRFSDEVIGRAVRAINEMISVPGLVQIDIKE